MALDVMIVGEHPHAGKVGSVVSAGPGSGKVKCIKLPGSTKEMYEVRFENGDGCFVEKEHMRLIKPTAPRAKLLREDQDPQMSEREF